VTEVTVEPAPPARRVAGRPPSRGAWLAVALGASVAVVIGAQLWFRALQRLWPTDDPTLIGLQFGSFLLLTGGSGAVAYCGDLGLRVGATLEQWRRVVGWGAVLATATVLLVVVGGSNDYSASDPLFEVVLVPIGEELVFRGLLLGILVDQLRRRSGDDEGDHLAILYSALAFGAAHASNALFGVTLEFVAVQVIVATALGLILGHLRLRTRSLVAPVVLHALVNGINLLG
jgi:membrane protease YdiL (CAAX protease family)